jgi:pilus assembly protein Flp/PilA
MKRGLKRLWKEEEGQDLIEYVLLVTVVSLACVAGMSTLSTAINTAYSSASGILSGT